jgi:hypothetical protein
MKLIYEPPVAKTVQTIRVRDSNGKIWEIERSDVAPRRTIYEGEAIFNRALSTQTPEGEILRIPPFDNWAKAVIYDGKLHHPYGSLSWRGLE